MGWILLDYGKIAFESAIRLLRIPSLRNFLSLPTFYDERVLIFHRGIGRTKVEGYFWMFRIRTFFSKLFYVIQYPIQIIFKQFIKKEIDGKLSNPFTPRTSDYSEEKLLEEHDSVIFLPRWLRRTGPKQVRFWELFSPKKIILQETTIHEVIVLYSVYPPTNNNLLSKIPWLNRFFSTKIPEKSEVQIKLFQDIPLADTEMILPNIKRIGDLNLFFRISKVSIPIILGYIFRKKKIPQGEKPKSHPNLELFHVPRNHE